MRNILNGCFYFFVFLFNYEFVEIVQKRDRFAPNDGATIA